MLYSLRWKILIGFIIIVALAIGTVAVVATWTTSSEFDRYISQDKALKYQQLASILSSYYEQTGSWKGVQELIDRIDRTYNSQIVLANEKGTIVGDSSRHMLGQDSQDELSLKIATLGTEENPSGFLYLKDRRRAEIEKKFLSSVNNSVILATIVSIIGAILLTVFYSRKALNPIQELTSAAEQIRQGELDQEVRVKTRDEIGELASTFNSMAEELKKQERLRKNMVSDVAHELRSPLTKSHGYLEAIKEGSIEPDEKVIDSLYRNSKMLKRLVEDLRDLSMAEAGQLKLKKKPILLEDIISDAIESLRFRLDQEGLNVQVTTSETLLVEVDPSRIKQVLRNLLDNAITHSNKGDQITVSTKVHENHVKVAVSDNGSGIPKQDIPYIFNRFYRVDSSRSRATGGSGLGLTIAKKIIEAHNGEISVESSEGEGTTFAFSLPLANG